MFWNKKKSENLDSAVIELGREVERGLLLLNATIIQHWEHEENDYYKAVSDLPLQLLNTFLHRMLKGATNMFLITQPLKCCMRRMVQPLHMQKIKVMSIFRGDLLDGLILVAMYPYV